VDLSAPRIDRIGSAMAREIQSGGASVAQQRAGSVDGAALRLDALQRDALAAPLAAFAAAASEPTARAAWQDLTAAVAAMEVPLPLLERLGAVVEAALASGQARREGGAGAELALRALFIKTPRGRTAADSVTALNAALAALGGEPLSQASASLRGPGVYALTLETSRLRLVIGFGPDGVRAESAEVEVG
jgi:hypothetical protein